MGCYGTQREPSETMGMRISRGASDCMRNSERLGKRIALHWVRSLSDTRVHLPRNRTSSSRRLRRRLLWTGPARLPWGLYRIHLGTGVCWFALGFEHCGARAHAPNTISACQRMCQIWTRQTWTNADGNHAREESQGRLPAAFLQRHCQGPFIARG